MDRMKIKSRIDPIIHKIQVEFDRLLNEAINEGVGDTATNTYLQNQTISQAEEIGKLKAKLSLLKEELINDSNQYLEQLARLEKDKDFYHQISKSRFEQIRELENKETKLEKKYKEQKVLHLNAVDKYSISEYQNRNMQDCLNCVIIESKEGTLIYRMAKNCLKSLIEAPNDQ